MGDNIGVLANEKQTAQIIRSRNTTCNGKPFDAKTIEEVWKKALPDWDLQTYKRDCAGAVLAKNEFGLQTTNGWEIDHILPVALGGTDELENLQPLHWKNNAAKGNTYPNWDAAKKY